MWTRQDQTHDPASLLSRTVILWVWPTGRRADLTIGTEPNLRLYFETIDLRFASKNVLLKSTFQNAFASMLTRLDSPVISMDRSAMHPVQWAFTRPRSPPLVWSPGCRDALRDRNRAWMAGGDVPQVCQIPGPHKSTWWEMADEFCRSTLCGLTQRTLSNGWQPDPSHVGSLPPLKTRLLQPKRVGGPTKRWAFPVSS